jgi:DNA-binding protein HU-beta
MTKKEFVEAVAGLSGLNKKDTETAINAVINSLQSVLAKGDSITFPGFGSFSVKERAERNGRNPSTGKPIKIPASKAAVFKAGTKLKEAVNK